MDWLITVGLLVGGLILLTKGADWLVDGSAAIARRLGVSAMIVGLTIVALGTSLPELMVSLYAVLTGSPDISVANIVGSNIVNIALIIGLSAAFIPLVVKDRTLIYEFPFLVVSSLFLLILSNDNNIFGINTFSLGRFDGIVLLTVFLIFFIYIYHQMKNHKETKIQKEC